MLAGRSHNHQRVSIPWGAWYQDSTVELLFPGNCAIVECSMVDAPALSMDELNRAFESPIRSKVLRELAKGKERIVIAVEDITRPTKLLPILERLLSELNEAGLTRDQITFVICNGGHAPMLGRDLNLKLGSAILSEYLVTNHNMTIWQKQMFSLEDIFKN
jgi:nickel-dependent lactate racemase